MRRGSCGRWLWSSVGNQQTQRWQVSLYRHFLSPTIWQHWNTLNIDSKCGAHTMHIQGITASNGWCFQPSEHWLVYSISQTPAPNKSQCGTNMEQIGEDLSRGWNMLDLMLPNRLTSVNRCTISPGVSDHDVLVILDTNIIAEPNKKCPWECWLHQNAD